MFLTDFEATSHMSMAFRVDFDREDAARAGDSRILSLDNTTSIDNRLDFICWDVRPVLP
jgi:hypothetical protein